MPLLYTLLELNVCGDSPQVMLQAQARKGGKEECLIIASHLEDIGLETSFYTIEISSLGHTRHRFAALMGSWSHQF